MSREESFRAPAGEVDRLPNESDRERAARLHEWIRQTPTTDRGYLHEHRQVLALGEEDLSDPARLADVRYSQLGLVWAVLERAAVDRQRSADWRPARAVAIMKAHAADVEGWLGRLPDMSAYRGARGQAQVDGPLAWWRRHPQHLHVGPPHLREKNLAAEAIDEIAHRNIIEWGLLHSATMLWAGLHPSSVELTGLARAVSRRLSEYWEQTGGRFVVAPDPEVFRVRIGQYLDMFAQATGQTVENPTGVRVLNTRAIRLGWAAPRTSL